MTNTHLGRPRAIPHLPTGLALAALLLLTLTILPALAFAQHSHGDHSNKAKNESAHGHTQHNHGADMDAGECGPVSVNQPWVRPTPPGTTLTAFYATLSLAEGGEGDRLLGAFSPLANVAEVHEVVTREGAMVMQPVQGGVAIPAGGETALKPGGYHIMLIGLKQPIAPGDQVTVLLWFERAGTVTVQATAADEMPMGGMSHGAHNAHH